MGGLVQSRRNKLEVPRLLTPLPVEAGWHLNLVFRTCRWGASKSRPRRAVQQEPEKIYHFIIQNGKVKGEEQRVSLEMSIKIYIFKGEALQMQALIQKLTAMTMVMKQVCMNQVAVRACLYRMDRVSKSRRSGRGSCQQPTSPLS